MRNPTTLYVLVVRFFFYMLMPWYAHFYVQQQKEDRSTYDVRMFVHINRRIEQQQLVRVEVT